MIAPYGWEEAVGEFDAGKLKVNVWRAAKATPKASRVAGFVVMWAMAMRDEALDGFSITEYQRYWSEGERQAYRLQKDFRELWPEYETPDELARQIVKYLDSQAAASGKSRASLPLTVPVVA